jgi:hypothetical protein
MKPRKIDFNGRDWAAHAQDHWLDFAGNPNFPDYLRTVFVAYGRHAANGHAVLERGELAYFLVRRDGTLPERRIVSRAVQEAVNLGFLAEGSRLLCLVVSSHDVQGGRGNPTARCRRDHTRRGTNVRSDSGRFTPNVRNGGRRSDTNVRNDCGRSVLAPSISLVPSHNVTAPAPPEPDTTAAGA